MFNTKLVTALRTLSLRERLRWRQFVFSEYFNKHKQVRALCDLLLQQAPDFDDPTLAKGKVWPLLFADEPYNELKINNLISDLLSLLYDFLAAEKFAERLPQQKALLLEALLERDLLPQTNEPMARFRQIQDKNPLRSAAWMRDEVLFYEKAEQISAARGRRDYDENVQHYADTLDLAFALEKLRVCCAMLSRNSVAVISAAYELHHLEDVRRWCAERPLLAENPVVQVYLAGLRLLEHMQAIDYHYFKEKLVENAVLLPQPEQGALYTYALNFCIRQINAGQVDWYHETLDLYQKLLAQGTLLQNGHLSQWTYKNIVTAGLRSREFAWTENFIRESRELLPAADRDNAFAYNFAVLNFEKKDYRAALLALQNVEFTDHTYHLGAKIIQLKSYFALDEGEALLSLADATEKFLRRNRHLSPYGKTANLNFLKLMRRIFQLKNIARTLRPPERAARLAKLRAAAAQVQPLANKDWIDLMLRD